MTLGRQATAVAPNVHPDGLPTSSRLALEQPLDMQAAILASGLASNVPLVSLLSKDLRDASCKYWLWRGLLQSLPGRILSISAEMLAPEAGSSCGILMQPGLAWLVTWRVTCSRAKSAELGPFVKVSTSVHLSGSTMLPAAFFAWLSSNPGITRMLQ